MDSKYLSPESIRAAASVVEVAGARIGRLWKEGAIADEDDFTSRLLERIAHELQGSEFGGVSWNAKKLTSRAVGAEERQLGADLLGVLRVELPEVQLTKGFLAQAKLVRPGVRDLETLRLQCERMLRVTPDSFVFLYDKRGVTVIPAIVFGAGTLRSRDIDPWPLNRFFEAHLASFIGDRRLAAANRNQVETLIDELEIAPRETLIVTATVKR